ncbi:hypothetical protein MRX96_031142 [Rhipicephalus microplus]
MAADLSFRSPNSTRGTAPHLEPASLGHGPPWSWSLSEALCASSKDPTEASLEPLLPSPTGVTAQGYGSGICGRNKWQVRRNGDSADPTDTPVAYCMAAYTRTADLTNPVGCQLRRKHLP